MSEYDQEAQVRQSFEHLADRAASKAVKETFLMLGVDINDPIAAQEQFAAIRRLTTPRVAENLEFLDRWHTASDRVSDAGWRAFVKVAVTGVVGLFAVITKDYWLGHIWRP